MISGSWLFALGYLKHWECVLVVAHPIEECRFDAFRSPRSDFLTTHPNGTRQRSTQRLLDALAASTNSTVAKPACRVQRALHELNQVSRCVVLAHALPQQWDQAVATPKRAVVEQRVGPVVAEIGAPVLHFAVAVLGRALPRKTAVQAHQVAPVAGLQRAFSR